ncbi:alanine--tRNA ligase [Geothrix oryzae]|uniref:Alanine--tRNA ligase n=1 Tax=Geothrix oryzae TaxID=2927975 RepID=A0ABN6V2X1_9BACT|nr:alanine--tRNA ligase [Geothrix oryzae]BDU70673.1 alanine--tRNA ligase [Geothrix oryzae]
MKTSELRQRFLQYFERQGHRRVASSAVIGPADDPTVMWTNSGMIQFKDVFLGKEKRDYSRATTSQKCLRAGGKHNDLDQVGFTARHHTFFEMLGNFSFGDYFKADAIRFAWEFVTGPVDQGCLNLDPDKLWITVFEGAEGVPADTEAEEMWKAAGARPDRIMRFGKKDNFWQMGDTGPCGPCSEMHFDRGAHIPGDATPNGEGDRVMEIWNLVFMQYERDAQGVLSPLPKPSIDTGMGLERTASILQGVDTNYEIDLFSPIFEAIWKAAKVNPEDRLEHANRTASQVVADHIRAATFMCFDGVVPSNEGRGYVLRKIIRRALRFGRKLGIEGLFFADLAPAVYEAMGDQYPELLGELGRIQKSLHREEQQFSQTLSTGLKILESSDVSSGTLAGSDIFRLYDTYGFPVDLVEDWCRERGITADLTGFQQELGAQRTRARAAMKAHDLRLAGDLAVLAELPPTRFTGYDHLESQAHVVALFDAGHRRVKQLTGEGFVLLDRTPFYAQSGGQVGDTGQLRFEGGHAEVLDCTAPAQKRHLHKVVVTGALLENTAVNALVHPIRRRRVRAHHTATHLLHAALREVLGTHVKQAGSVVDEHRLRFDFTHFAPLEPEQIAEIERLASRQALKSVPTRVNEMDIEEALASGAMALFGEKYGEVVRVVQVPGFSTELCGGTHVANTGEIGVVKILSEGAVAAGVRRIEAVAGEMALELLQADEAMIQGLSRQANAAREVLPELLSAKDHRIAQLERDLKEAKLKAASGGSGAEQVEQIKGVTLVTASVEGLEGNALRELMDQVRTRHAHAVIVLASKVAEDKVAALVSVSPGLSYDAGALFKVMLPALNGRGGGKKDLAQGGGTQPAGLPEAFAALRAAL